MHALVTYELPTIQSKQVSMCDMLDTVGGQVALCAT